MDINFYNICYILGLLLVIINFINSINEFFFYIVDRYEGLVLN